MNEEDSFDDLMGGEVTPVSHSQRHERAKGQREPSKDKQAARDNATEEAPKNYLSEHLDEHFRVQPDHEFKWRRDGTQLQVMQNLKFGTYEPQAHIDLHRLTIAEARERVWNFLEGAREKGFRTVQIIHGKGIKSNPPATLKSYVGQVLQDYKHVIGYCSAPEQLGGAGATLIWIRKSDELKSQERERIQSRKG